MGNRRPGRLLSLTADPLIPTLWARNSFGKASHRAASACFRHNRSSDPAPGAGASPNDQGTICGLPIWYSFGGSSPRRFFTK